MELAPAQRGMLTTAGFHILQKVSTLMWRGDDFERYPFGSFIGRIPTMTSITPWVQKDNPWCIFFQIPETSPQCNMAWASKNPAFFGMNLLIVSRFRRFLCTDHVPCFISHPASEEELQSRTFGATPRADLV